MPFRVAPISSLVSPDVEGEAFYDKMEEALDRMEAEGWTLTKIVDQHREWPTTDEDAMNVGWLTQPIFIWHREGQSKARLL